MPQDDKMHFRHVTLCLFRAYHVQNFIYLNTCTPKFICAFIFFYRSASFGIFMQHDENRISSPWQNLPLSIIFLFFSSTFERRVPKKLYKRHTAMRGGKSQLRDGHWMTQMVIYCSIFCTSIILNNGILCGGFSGL